MRLIWIYKMNVTMKSPGISHHITIKNYPFAVGLESFFGAGALSLFEAEESGFEVCVPLESVL